MSYSLCRMGDVEQVPRQRSSARMGGRGTGEWEGQGGWRCMLITSGAGGRALQVSVPQRSIHSGSGLVFHWPLAVTDHFSQLTYSRKTHLRHDPTELWFPIISVSICSKYMGISLRVSLEIINLHYDSFADNYHSMWLSQEILHTFWTWRPLNTLSSMWSISVLL